MAASPRVSSLAAVVRMATDVQSYSLALRDFLDGFYEAPSAERLREEPGDLTPVLHDEGPAWSLQPARVAVRPTFALETHEGRMFLLLDSPVEFRARNIFIGADGLTRA